MSLDIGMIRDQLLNMLLAARDTVQSIPICRSRALTFYIRRHVC